MTEANGSHTKQIELAAKKNLDAALREGEFLDSRTHPVIDFFGTPVFDPWIKPESQDAEAWPNHEGTYATHDPYVLYGEKVMADFSDALLSGEARCIAYHGIYREDIFSGDVPDADNWAFERIEDGCGEVRCRFVLAHRIKSDGPMLAVVGANPSTAHPGEKGLDPTMRNVKKFVEQSNTYGGFVMVNLCPICCSNPKKIPANKTPLVSDLLDQNLKIIERTLDTWGVQDVCAAWGKLIDNNPATRNMLKEQAKRIDLIVHEHDCRWKCVGLTNDGHPMHPRAWYIGRTPSILDYICSFE